MGRSVKREVRTDLGILKDLPNGSSQKASVTDMSPHGMLLATILLIYGILHGTHGQERSTDSTIRKLRQYLFQNYDVNARPVNHHNSTTDVQINYTPVHIVDMNENTGILTMEGWVTMSWSDEHLKWDPAKFSGLKVLRITETDVWKPDITVYNGQAEHSTPWEKVKLLVFNNGIVMWVPPATFRLVCGFLDYSKYPKDTQECILKLGSWTNDAYQMDLKLEGERVNLTNFANNSNPHWQLLSVKGTRDVKFYECCTEPYVSVSYRMKIKRTNVPFAALCSTPETVARLLILCMFWISSGTRKLLVGSTSLLILSVLSVGVTVSIPSPSAAPFALSSISSAFALTVAALIVELVAIAVSTFRLTSPSFIDGISNSTLCQLLVPCHHGQLKEDVTDTSGTANKKNQWPFMSILIDRAAFVVFAVLLVLV